MSILVLAMDQKERTGNTELLRGIKTLEAHRKKESNRVCKAIEIINRIVSRSYDGEGDKYTISYILVICIYILVILEHSIFF